MSPPRVGVGELLEESLAVISCLEWSADSESYRIHGSSEWRNASYLLRIFAQVINVCKHAKRNDLAETFLDALLISVVGRSRAHLLLETADEDVDLIVDALLVELLVRNEVPSTRGKASPSDTAAYTLRASVLLRGKTPRVRELDRAARAIVDKYADSSHLFSTTVAAYVERGDHAAARSILERAIASPAPMQSSMVFALWLLDSPKRILELTTAHNVHELLSSNLADLTEWSADQISHLAKQGIGASNRPRLAELLVECERMDEAKALVFGPAWSPKPEQLPGLHALFGDTKMAQAAQERLDASPLPNNYALWFRRQYTQGLKAPAELLTLTKAQAPDGEQMTRVSLLHGLLEAMHSSRAPEVETAPVIESIEALFADPHRHPAQRASEGRRLTEFRLLKTKLRLAQGDWARAEAEVERDVADYRILVELANARPDRRMREHYTANYLFSLADRAALVGRADLALKVAMQIPKHRRVDGAWRVARAFLPDASAALASVDGLAGENRNEVLTNSGCLVELWQSVLGQPRTA